ncbi:MAG: response regulator [Bacteroidia bacterium]|jgi:CheY-like chemotaxis protein|nr:response regulator [Bacteroidia bacterium]
MSKHLLLIDDDEMFLFIQKRLISSSNLIGDPICFTDVLAALEHIKNNPEQISLIFLDINMPIMDGWDFMDELKKNDLKNVKVVIVTSSINQDDRIRANNYDIVVGFIEKPVKVESLNALEQNNPGIQQFYTAQG